GPGAARPPGRLAGAGLDRHPPDPARYSRPAPRSAGPRPERAGRPGRLGPDRRHRHRARPHLRLAWWRRRSARRGPQPVLSLELLIPPRGDRPSLVWASLRFDPRGPLGPRPIIHAVPRRGIRDPPPAPWRLDRGNTPAHESPGLAVSCG